MTAGGTVTVLHVFIGGPTDGANPSPSSALIQGTDGNFYGTTSHGGTSDAGTVFKMTPSGTVTVLHAFTSGPTDGADPSGLIQATDGNFYRTTGSGGTSSLPTGTTGYGTVFKMTPAGGLTVLYNFSRVIDGAFPHAGLLQGADGNFYGTTVMGAVFRLTGPAVVPNFPRTVADFDGGWEGRPRGLPTFRWKLAPPKLDNRLHEQYRIPVGSSRRCAGVR